MRPLALSPLFSIDLKLLRRRAHAAVRTDPRLTALWLEQMQTFTEATIAQITADPRARQNLAGQDIAAVASALTWLGERLYYLAATSTPPFHNQGTLVDTLLHIWTSALYKT